MRIRYGRLLNWADRHSKIQENYVKLSESESLFCLKPSEIAALSQKLFAHYT